jgi:hypothetical protein
MRISFLTPAAGVIALLAIVPLVVLLDGERRARRLRALLRLDAPSTRGRALWIGGVVAVPILVALAAMQPVIDRSEKHVSRTDAEVYFVIDTSRSMAASGSAKSRTRLQRARASALEIRTEIGDMPAGIASMTDRVLPHLFPTSDPATFTATLERSVGVDRPPPVNFNRTATALGALASLPTRGFYSPEITRRVAVVFTDAESRAFSTAGLASVFQRPPGVLALIVRVGNADERVYTIEGDLDLAYQSDPNAYRTAQAAAIATGGLSFEEGDEGRVVRAIRSYVGSGRTEVRGDDRTKFALAPFTAAFAFLPLGLVLWRRNL